MVRIRIVGGTGSGKTTLAKQLAKKYRIPHYDLDDIHFTDDRNYQDFRDAKERDRMLRAILKKKDWIIEGTQTREWTVPTFVQADKVIFLDAPRLKRQYRIIHRWARGKTGLSDRKEGSLLQLLIHLKYAWGSYERQMPRLARMNLGEKLIVVKKAEELR